ncbi:hypothetical protein DFH28DRAFT_1158378, partial [Melampsora americana]
HSAKSSSHSSTSIQQFCQNKQVSLLSRPIDCLPFIINHSAKSSSHSSTSSQQFCQNKQPDMPPIRSNRKESQGKSGHYSAPHSKTKARPRKPHLDDEFKPNKAGHEYGDNCILSSIVDQYLRQMIRNAKEVVIDYDLAVAFFLDETSHMNLPDIPKSVNTIIHDYEILPAITSQQHDLLTCALHIRKIIESFLTEPGSDRPFALRYPNIKALNQLIKDRLKDPRALCSDKAVIVVDLAGRLLLINLLKYMIKLRVSRTSSYTS